MSLGLAVTREPNARAFFLAEWATVRLISIARLPAPQPTDERLSQESSEAYQSATEAICGCVRLHPRAAQALIRGGSW